jgi:hypothetical protein
MLTERRIGLEDVLDGCGIHPLHGPAFRAMLAGIARGPG